MHSISFSICYMASSQIYDLFFSLPSRFGRLEDRQPLHNLVEHPFGRGWRQTRGVSDDMATSLEVQNIFGVASGLSLIHI